MRRPPKERLLRVKPDVLYEKVAEILKEDPKLVKEVVMHQFATTRKIMEAHEYPSVKLQGLGTFEVMSFNRYKRRLTEDYIPRLRSLIRNTELNPNLVDQLKEKKEELGKLFKFRRKVYDYHHTFKVSPKKGEYMLKIYNKLKAELKEKEENEERRKNNRS